MDGCLFQAKTTQLKCNSNNNDIAGNGKNEDTNHE